MNTKINDTPQTAEQFLGMLIPDAKAPPKKPTSAKQIAIVSAIRERGQLTKKEAVALVGGDIYHNADFHVGNILSNMVKRGMIVRVKPGLFSL